MVFIGEAWHGIVGLWFEISLDDPSLGDRPENGNRLSAIKLRTNAVMKTVFPARDSPVTPNRTVGVVSAPR